MSELAITLTTDMEELTRCQQAVSLLMNGDLPLDDDARSQVAGLLNFLATAQQRYFDALQTRAA